MTLLPNGVLRYDHFRDFLEFCWGGGGDRMDNLGLTDFKLGLYIKVNVNKGLNKSFDQHGHQLTQNRPDATFGQEH